MPTAPSTWRTATRPPVELLTRLRRQGDRRVRPPRAPDGAAGVRFGLGIDTHRFAEGRPLILGGVEIPHDRGLAGWSDADVLAHAVTDAVLGAAGMGDIGQHFPDTDPAFKGADSLALLREAVARVAAEGWRVEYVDATVMLERPKVAPAPRRDHGGAERGRRRARAREGDDRRGDGLRRPRGGRRRARRRDAGAMWTIATVETLAPDPASITAARKLARPAPWSETGRDERAVWGRCQGSGKTPYQVQVDTTGPAYTCSCPSRKVPCKHALALLLLAAGGEVREGERPEWVQERREPAPTRAPGEPPRDPEAAARRAAEREERVAAGVEDLRRWLRDAVRGGLGAGRLRTWDEWDAFAARMVDAQAPGAASRLRSLAASPPVAPMGGRSGCCPAWGCCTCSARRTGAPTDRCATTCARCSAGTSRARTCWRGPHVRDRWIVLARVVLEQERLRVARTWLWGRALGARGAAARLRPAGRAARAAAPGGLGGRRRAGLLPRRHAAARARRRRDERPRRRAGRVRHRRRSRRRSRAPPRRSPTNPWLDEWPVALAAAVPDSATWSLSAQDGSLPMRGAQQWRLLALSGGRPVVGLRAVERRSADAARGRRWQ